MNVSSTAVNGSAGWAALAKGLATLLAAALLLPACAQPRSPERVEEIKLSTALGPAYAQGKAGEVWAALIRDRSAGRIAVKHYPGAALVQRDPAREFAALREGHVDMAVGSTLAWCAQVPQLNLLALPWLIPDEATLDLLLAGDTGARLSSAVEAAGVVPLLLSANGLSALATRVAVHKPADLVGMKIRVQGSPLTADTFAALGATSSSMGLAEARAAWASGALDGQEVNVATYTALRLDAMGLTHLLLWQARADALVFAVNHARWAAWNEDERELVRRAARDAAREARALQRGSEEPATVAREGAIVTRLTAQGREAFRAAAEKVYDAWVPVVGEDLVRGAQAAIAASQPSR